MQLIREYGGIFRAVAAAILWLAAILCTAAPARAEFSQYDTATYDWVNLGTPKFINTNYIDLRKITQISKFRSHVGHDYSDTTQFNLDSIKIPGQPIENCRSMKHYFVQPDETVDIFAPVSGVISRVFEEELGTQIHITADDQPAFTIAIFHIKTDKVAQVGDRVTEGQHLGKHFTSGTYSDMAVMVHTPTGYHLVSYFEALTDAAFAPFKARGLASPADVEFTRAQADASAGCALFSQFPPDSDFITLTGGAATQTLTLSSSLPTVLHPGDPPVTLNATSSAGLPVTITPINAKVCLVIGNTLVAQRAGQCAFKLTQDGDPNTFAAQPQFYSLSVLPVGAPPWSPPRLANVYPPAATGPQSYIRITGAGAGGTAKLVLSDAATGKDLFTWTGAIAPNTAPQLAISDLEKQAPAQFTRPAMYGLRVADDSTVGGYIQHVLYRPGDGTFTNVTTCQGSVTAQPYVLGNIHSSKIGSIGFPSWLVVHNTTSYDYLNQFLNIYDAGSGATLASTFLLLPVIRVNAATIEQIPDLEAAAHINPANIYQYVVSPLSGGLLQHLVINQAAGLITDMTAVCSMNSPSGATVMDPLRAGTLFSSRQAAAQSYLRFYNMGTTPGPVTITLFDSTTGTQAGTWTSPPIPGGAEQ